VVVCRLLLVVWSHLHLCFFAHPSGGGPTRRMYLHSGIFNFVPAFCSFFVLRTDSLNFSRKRVFKVLKDGSLLLSFSSHIENWKCKIEQAKNALYSPLNIPKKKSFFYLNYWEDLEALRRSSKIHYASQLP
jgi:hypothetical protein